MKTRYPVGISNLSSWRPKHVDQDKGAVRFDMEHHCGMLRTYALVSLVLPLRTLLEWWHKSLLKTSFKVASVVLIRHAVNRSPAWTLF
jgi:hypothetical protein